MMSTNEMDIKFESANEVMMEICKLRQDNQILRAQLLMAEETNSQLTLEIGNEKTTAGEHRRKIDKLNNSLEQRTHENEILHHNVEEQTIRANELEERSSNLAISQTELRAEMKKRESTLEHLTRELDKTQDELSKSDNELAKQKNASSALNAEYATLQQKLLEANFKINESCETIAGLKQTNADMRAENECLVEKLATLGEKFANTTKKLLIKTYIPNATFGLDDSDTRARNDKYDENMNVFDESESIINLHIASNLNDNTFHLSPDQVNFFSERQRSNSEIMRSTMLDASKTNVHFETSTSAFLTQTPTNNYNYQPSNVSPEEKNQGTFVTGPRPSSFVPRSKERKITNLRPPHKTTPKSVSKEKKKNTTQATEPNLLITRSYALVSWDSFKPLRLITSIRLIVFSVIFFISVIVLTMANKQENDVYGLAIAIASLIQNIEIKSFGNELRPN